jgi:hypothetical protein
MNWIFHFQQCTTKLKKDGNQAMGETVQECGVKITKELLDQARFEFYKVNGYFPNNKDIAEYAVQYFANSYSGKGGKNDKKK